MGGPGLIVIGASEPAQRTLKVCFCLCVLFVQLKKNIQMLFCPLAVVMETADWMQNCDAHLRSWFFFLFLFMDWSALPSLLPYCENNTSEHARWTHLSPKPPLIHSYSRLICRDCPWPSCCPCPPIKQLELIIYEGLQHRSPPPPPQGNKTLGMLMGWLWRRGHLFPDRDGLGRFSNASAWSQTFPDSHK